MQEKLVTSMSREDIDFVANSEDAVRNLCNILNSSSVGRIIYIYIYIYIYSILLFWQFFSVLYAVNLVQSCKCHLVATNPYAAFVLFTTSVKLLQIEIFHFVALFATPKLLGWRTIAQVMDQSILFMYVDKPPGSSALLIHLEVRIIMMLNTIVN